MLSKSWETRDCDFKTDGDTSMLGQPNTDWASTRSKITHVELLRKEAQDKAQMLFEYDSLITYLSAQALCS